MFLVDDSSLLNNLEFVCVGGGGWGGGGEPAGNHSSCINHFGLQTSLIEGMCHLPLCEGLASKTCDYVNLLTY